MTNPILPQSVTTKPSIGGVLQTINPLSFLTPGKDYVPASLINMFKSSDPEWNAQGSPAKVAHLLAKIVGGGAVLGAGAWGLRHLMHSIKLDSLDAPMTSATAGQKLQKMYARPTKPGLTYGKQEQDKLKQLKKEQKLDKKSLIDWYRVAQGALPPAAALLAIAASYKVADKHYDTKLSQTIDQKINNAVKERDTIAKRRILKNRGIISPQEQKPLVQKEASVGGFIGAAAGAAAMLLAAASFAGGYTIGAGNDKNTAKYKAYKKGLQAYNKARLSQQTVQSEPLDPKLMELFNANLNKKKRVQDIPPVESTTYRSVLL